MLEADDLPVGYRDFHGNDFINYQMNRWYSVGYTRGQDLERAGEAIDSHDDYPGGSWIWPRRRAG